jgi:hypothetical protein
VNLAEAQQAVRDRGFDYLADSRLTLMLNTAKDIFEDLYEWPWLQFMFFDQPTPLPMPDLKFILNVKVAATKDELLGLDLRQVYQDATDPLQPGTPEYWWIFSQLGMTWLRVWPGDGTNVDVVYTADSVPLVNPDDTPLIPARYHPLWIDLAVCEGYKDSDNFPAAQALRLDVNMRITDVIGRFEVRNRQHSPFMSIRNWSEDD